MFGDVPRQFLVSKGVDFVKLEAIGSSGAYLLTVAYKVELKSRIKADFLVQQIMGNCIQIQVPCEAFYFPCQNFLGGKARYVWNLEENLDALQNALDKLIEAKNDVERRVDLAEQQPQMRRLYQVDGWLTRVQDVQTEVAGLMRNKSEEIGKLCLCGFCSKSCKSSYRFGKTVAQKLATVEKLMKEGKFEEVAERDPDDPVDEKPNEPIIVGQDSMLDKVWKCLMEEKDAGVIGLYGMGGVGKTTLLTKINNKFLDSDNDFDIVIWAVVSKEVQIERIQEKIGDKIGLLSESWKTKSSEEKASDIFKNLSRKKFVLLLDDLWKHVDLKQVGVPLPNIKNASKVVITTRFIHVCSEMDANPKFKVECLRQEDAWTLFQCKVGDDTLKSHPEIPGLAEILIEECDGLPLALITIGRAMAPKKTPEEWKYAIEVLRESSFKFPGMQDKVYRLLKFSYDSLADDTIRSCLLYCSLYPEDYRISIRDLIDQWVGEEFLEDKIVVQNKGYDIIGILRAACLLEEAEGNCVKMHDVIRDMAMWIARDIEKEKEGYFVCAGAGLTEAPHVEDWNTVRRMSMMENQIEILSESPKCPHLLTLFLNSNRLKLIHDGYFQFMPCLKVLNLSDNLSLTKLPSEISKLISLQHLDLSKTAIEELPKELEVMVRLKSLNLEHTSRLCKIPRQLISKFLMLNVLRMLDCGSSSEVPEESVLFNNGEFLIDELICLKSLHLLNISLKSSEVLQKFLSSQTLLTSAQSLCLQFLGRSKSLKVLSTDMKYLDTLKIMDCKYLEELKIDCVRRLQRTRRPFGFESLHVVEISSCSRLKDLTWLILAPTLNRIVVSHCAGVEEIINARKLGEFPEMTGNLIPFKLLQFLELKHLPNLQSIYRTALPLLHLKEMYVYECPKLKKLPLDSNSTKEGTVLIKGQKQWWEELQWEDQATQSAFRPCFKSCW